MVCNGEPCQRGDRILDADNTSWKRMMKQRGRKGQARDRRFVSVGKFEVGDTSTHLYLLATLPRVLKQKCDYFRLCPSLATEGDRFHNSRATRFRANDGQRLVPRAERLETRQPHGRLQFALGVLDSCGNSHR